MFKRFISSSRFFFDWKLQFTLCKQTHEQDDNCSRRKMSADSRVLLEERRWDVNRCRVCCCWSSFTLTCSWDLFMRNNWRDKNFVYTACMILGPSVCCAVTLTHSLSDCSLRSNERESCSLRSLLADAHHMNLSMLHVLMLEARSSQNLMPLHTVLCKNGCQLTHPHQHPSSS